MDQTPPESKNTVKYLSRLVHENAQRAQFDADAEWFQFVKTGHSLRFSNNHGSTTTASAWAARLLSLSRTRSFSPKNLVAFFDWSHAQSFPFRTHTTLSYTIVLRGLLLKGAYALALDLWEQYRSLRLHLDLVALGVGVQVLTRAGHPVRALALIDDLANSNANPSSPSKGATHRHILRKPKPKRPRVPVSIVTHFMRALDESNPSAALRVWDHMGTLYNVTPDARAFTVMLDAARHATLGGETFKGALQELGFSKFPFRWRLPFLSHHRDHDDEPAELATAVTESLDRARRRTYEQLEQSLVVNKGDMWGNERACRRAHRLFKEALLASWPLLAEVRPPPTRAVRTSSHDPATAPLRDLKHFLMPPPPDSDPKLDIDFDDESQDLSPPTLPIHLRGAYPSFSPDDATFRAEILLVGTTGTAPTEIPLILAWMRALGLTPRTRTLAYALVFWAEMSRSSPLLERFQNSRGGGGGGGEYVTFVRWLEEWVGVGNLPDEKEVGEAVRRVEAMRQGRSGQSYSGESPP
ncbi:hypothetical protein BGW80DRAFT_1334121 [Lactifluus volemus]|nr:hypothetical protein BGW80DRAFT_1334121 [Lactifluus volemus]